MEEDPLPSMDVSEIVGPRQPEVVKIKPITKKKKLVLKEDEIEKSTKKRAVTKKKLKLQEDLEEI